MLQSVLLDNADAILIIAEDGTIMAVNPAAEELFGRLAGDLVGSAFGYPLTVDAAAELDILGSDEPRVAEMHVAATRWAGESIHVATLRDITERRRIEERMRGFLSVASHELRTPATSIHGFATTLLDHYGVLSEEERRNSLEVIARQSKRLVGLATDLLELARVEDGRVQCFPRRIVVRDCLRAAVEAAAIGEVEIRCPDDLVAVVDDEHVTTILVNLLSNAGKYGAAPFSIDVAADGGTLELVVRDCGDGVPPEFRPHLFERFARADGRTRNVSGTGLGLALVASLAEVNGGSSWYRPNEPSGSQFGLSLPVAPA